MEGVISHQNERRQLILNEIKKTKQSNQALIDRVKQLERQVYGEKYVNQISDLTDKNMDLMIDIHILAYQNDLLTNKTVRNDLVPATPAPVPVAGPSGIYFSETLNPSRKGSILDQRLPKSNEIQFQPINIITQPPQLPPRPKKPISIKPFRSSSREHNDGNRSKWKCAFCTLENDENLTNCESCNYSKILEPFANMISRNENNIIHAIRGEHHRSRGEKKSGGKKKSSRFS